MAIFKYKDDISIHAPISCPPEDAIETDLQAYRFVREPITGDDFLSHIKLGLLPRQTDPKHQKCSRCGLSMFITIESAQKKYESILKKSSFRYTHIAKGMINKTDGVLHSNSPNGHFDFYEYENIDLTNKFQIVKQLTA